MKSKKEVSEFLAVFSMKSEEESQEYERLYNKEMGDLHLKGIEDREEKMRSQIFQNIENEANNNLKQPHYIDFDISEDDYIEVKMAKSKNLQSVGSMYAHEILEGNIFECIIAKVKRIIYLSNIDYDNFIDDIKNCNMFFGENDSKYNDDNRQYELVSVIISEDRLPIVVNCLGNGFINSEVQ